jgi:putative cardiolipin synthase
MAGPLASSASTAFDEYWNSPWAVPAEDLTRTPVSKEEYAAFRSKYRSWVLDTPSDHSKYATLRDEYTRQVLERPEDMVWARGRLCWDPPGKMQSTSPETTPVALTLDAELKACSRQCLIEEGYFIPGEDGMSQILDLRNRGVEVRVLTSALEATDQPLVYSAYQRYRADLLRAGVEIHEYKLHAKVPPAKKRWLRSRRAPTSLHSKVMVFDERRIWIGSFNFDSRSVLYNTEIAALVDSPVLAEQLSTFISEGCRWEASWQVGFRGEHSDSPRLRLQWTGERDGEPATLTREPARSWWHRFRARFYSLIPGIEHLL